MKRAARCALRWLIVALAVATGGAWCTAGAETLAEAWQLAVARDTALAAAESDVQGAQAERSDEVPPLRRRADFRRH